MSYYNVWDTPSDMIPHSPTRREIDAFKAHLKANQDEALDAVMMIYLGQTTDERRTATTIYDNNVGYDQADAPILTPIAKRYWTGEQLTQRERLQAATRAPKYAGQYLWQSRFA